MKKKVYCYELDLDILPRFLEKIKLICKDYSNYMIFHQNEMKNHYTYIGLNPKEYIYTQEKLLNIVNKTQFLTKKEDYLKHIIEWLNRNELIYDGKLPPFIGGAMGFINDSLDDYYKNKTNLCDIPELCFMIFDDLIIVDHNQNKILFTYIGDLNNDEYYQYKYRQFIKLVDGLNLNQIEKSYITLKFNEDDILEKFNKISLKFNDDKYYIIKNTEKIILDASIEPIDIYYRLMSSNQFTSSSYFKTSDFSLMVNTSHNDLSFINNNLSLSLNDYNMNILNDLIREQIFRFHQSNKLNINQQERYLKVEGPINSTIYEVLKNFMLIHVNYGIPFERVHSYLRRTEGEYRLNGLIGLLGYNNNLIMSQIIEPILFDQDQHYLNIETYHTHITQGSQYVNEVINKVNHYLDLLDG